MIKFNNGLIKYNFMNCFQNKTKNATKSIFIELIFRITKENIQFSYKIIIMEYNMSINMKP